MQTRTTLTLLILAVTAIALALPATQAAGSSLAKPPAKTPTPAPTTPPLDGGTLYYHESGTSNRLIHEIQPDGSQDLLIGISANGGAKPSRQLHNGDRWYVTLREPDGVPGFFPGGASGGRLWELDLVRESDQARFPLTDFAGACFHLWGGGPGVRYNWAPDATGQVDGAISWLGARWEDVDDNGSCDQPVEGGIFRGAVAIDGGGNVSFSQPTAPEVVVALSGTSTRASEFAWAPDGQQVAYKDSDGADLWVVNALGNRSMIFDGRVFDMSWSPDLDPNTAGLQSRIAFTGAVSAPNGSDSELGTYTIAPDGAGRFRLAEAPKQRRSSDPFTFHWAVYWSPAGTYLTYTERVTTGISNIVERLRRVTASGTNNVVLVDTGTYRPFGIGWTID